MPFLLLTKVKQGVPGDEALETLAQDVTNDCYWMLGRRLKVRDTQLEEFHHQNGVCSQRAYKMLKDWKRGNGSSATYEVLYNALCHKLVKRVDLAEAHCCSG